METRVLAGTGLKIFKGNAKVSFCFKSAVYSGFHSTFSVTTVELNLCLMRTCLVAYFAFYCKKLQFMRKGHKHINPSFLSLQILVFIVVCICAAHYHYTCWKFCKWAKKMSASNARPKKHPKKNKTVYQIGRGHSSLE